MTPLLVNVKTAAKYIDWKVEKKAEIYPEIMSLSPLRDCYPLKFDHNGIDASIQCVCLFKLIYTVDILFDANGKWKKQGNKIFGQIVFGHFSCLGLTTLNSVFCSKSGEQEKFIIKIKRYNARQCHKSIFHNRVSCSNCETLYSSSNKMQSNKARSRNGMKKR